MSQLLPSELAFRLAAYYCSLDPASPFPCISEMTRLNSGWESELYTFNLQDDLAAVSAPQTLVLRLYGGGFAADKAVKEFRSLRLLRDSGYPVPDVMQVEPDSAWLGSPFMIMEYIPGPTLWSAISGSSPTQAAVLLDQFCQLFARLHALDWRPFSDEQTPRIETNPFAVIDGWLTDARQAVQAKGWTDFLPALEWLAQRRERLACLRLSVLHHDFHHDNILLRPDGSAVVIDWTGSHVSDLRLDLAWTLLLSYAYEGQPLRDLTLQIYQKHSAIPVEAIEVFEVMACLRRLYDVSTSLKQGAAQAGLHPGAQQAIRGDLSAHRRVYELLVTRTGIRIPAVEAIFASYP